MVLWTGVCPSGRGLPPLDGGNGPVLCPEPPSCTPNPRHDPRTRVQASRAERGVGVIGDAAPSASAWSPPRGASCTGGCLQHRGVRWERIRRCSAQPAVRGAAAGAPRTRRDRRPDHRPQRQQTPEPTENVLHASSCAERRGAGGAVESTWRPSEASPDRLEHPVAGCSRRLLDMLSTAWGSSQRIVRALDGRPNGHSSEHDGESTACHAPEATPASPTRRSYQLGLKHMLSK